MLKEIEKAKNFKLYSQGLEPVREKVCKKKSNVLKVFFKSAKNDHKSQQGTLRI